MTDLASCSLPSRMAVPALSAKQRKAWVNDLIEWQRQRCGACRRKFTPSRLPAVDHDHRTGKVRGLLCTRCNLLLGQIHDDLNLLVGLADYLESNPADECWPEPEWWPGSPGAAGLEIT